MADTGQSLPALIIIINFQLVCIRRSELAAGRIWHYLTVPRSICSSSVLCSRAVTSLTAMSDSSQMHKSEAAVPTQQSGPATVLSLPAFPRNEAVRLGIEAAQKRRADCKAEAEKDLMLRDAVDKINKLIPDAAKAGQQQVVHLMSPYKVVEGRFMLATLYCLEDVYAEYNVSLGRDHRVLGAGFEVTVRWDIPPTKMSS